MRLSVHIKAGRNVQRHDRLEHHNGRVQRTCAVIWGESLLFITFTWPLLPFHSKNRADLSNCKSQTHSIKKKNIYITFIQYFSLKSSIVILDQPSRRRSVSTSAHHRLLAHAKRNTQVQHTYSAA